MAQARISDWFIILFFVILFVPAAYAQTGGPAAATETGTPRPFPEIQLFTAEEGYIHSTEVLDATNGKNGEVVFATKYGLSVYNGSWSTRHITRDNLSEGLLDDFITAVAFDEMNNLWIGYPGGLQIYDGTSYQTIRDQQLLKDPRVLTLQRWGDAMWLGTGKSGIHRYRNNSWTWYQPGSRNGPGFYEVDSMALDPYSNALFIASRDEGLWTIPSSGDPVIFTQIEPAGTPLVRWHAVQCPQGGVFFFNEESVRHYSKNGFSTVLTTKDLTQKQISISDCTVATDGTLYLATDDGIYVWRDGSLTRHLGRYEGIGTSNIVRWVFTDARNRVWFATQDNVGYLEEPSAVSPIVTILIINQSSSPEISSTPAVTGTIPEITGTIQAPATLPGTAGKKEPSLLERIQEFVAGLMARFK